MTTPASNRAQEGNLTTPPSGFGKPDKAERDTQMTRRRTLRATIKFLLIGGGNPVRHDRMMCVLNNRDAGYISQDECDRQWVAFTREYGLDE
jgi:hypothetical protein